MQFITLYTPDAASKAKGPPSPEHMAETGAKTQELLNDGTLLIAGALGMRDKVAARITLKDGKYKVEDAPKGESVLFGASGVSVANAPSKEAMLESLKQFLADMGDGTCDVIGFAFPVMTPTPEAAARALPPLGGVIPYLNMKGAAEAADFYVKAFGAKEVARIPTGDGRLMHCHLEINGGSLMVADEFPEHGFAHQPSGSYTMQLVVNPADPWWARAVEAGCKITLPLERAPWGDRYGRLEDPFGIAWAVNEPACMKVG